MGSYHAWSVAQGQPSFSINDPYPLGAIGGNNATPFYLRFPGMPAGLDWVFPFVYGFLYPLPVALHSPFFIDTSTQPAGAQAPPVSTALAQLTSYRADPGVTFAFAAGTPSIAVTISRWNINNAPAAGSVASVTRAASPNVIHVADAFDFAIVQNAGAAEAVGCVVIDGVSGGTSYLWKDLLGVTATAGDNHSIQKGPAMGLRGTPGNAMTIEFQSNVAGVFEAVSLSGYDQ